MISFKEMVQRAGPLRPEAFAGYEEMLGAPADWDRAAHGECRGMPVAYREGCILSCWKLTLHQRVALLLGGRVWLWVIGISQPPVMLTVAGAS